MTIRLKNWTSQNSIMGVVVGAVRRTEQCWSIVSKEVVDWVEVIIARGDGREVGMRADMRAK